MNWFFYEFTPSYPYISSAIKFLILGSLGEYIGAVIKTNWNLKPYTFLKFLPKLLIWAILGFLIKWIFASFTLLVVAQANAGLLPKLFAIKGSFLFALAVSIEMNLLFTPFLMFLHRLLDNIFDKKLNFKGLEKALLTIFWFWIPAHIITFTLPINFQIIFAGFLSIMLGIILAYSSKK